MQSWPQIYGVKQYPIVCHVHKRITSRKIHVSPYRNEEKQIWDYLEDGVVYYSITL